MQSSGKIHIGTSGWHYDHWRGPWYPKDISRRNFLEYYADRFHTVEINNSFYQLPKKETLMNWRDIVPCGFIFTLKASRYITHMKKLKDARQALSSFLERITVLGERLGPILFQLPPRWRFDPVRLRDFLESLHGELRFAFEFRDPSWFDPRAYEVMMRYGVAFCIYELAGLCSPREVTADFIYIRLHGPEGAYQGKYQDNVLAGWADVFHTWADQGKEIYCYFDNDEAGYAAQDAWRLQEMIERDRPLK